MILSVKNNRIFWLILPFCLLSSFIFAQAAFAEESKCMSLVATADQPGEWSRAVTVCATKNDNGTVILTALGMEENYYQNGAKNSGVSSNVSFGDYASSLSRHGAVLNGNSGTGTISVRPFYKWGNNKASFKASDYNSPESFIRAVLNDAKTKVGSFQDKEVMVPVSGGDTVPNTTKYCSGGTACNFDSMENHMNQIASLGKNYTASDCQWVMTDSSTSAGAVTNTYDIVCGATSSHSQTVKYTLQIKEEKEEIAQQALAGASGATTEEESGEKEINCMNSGAADQLGWIVCNVLDLLSDGAQTLYDDYVEPALQVDPQLFATESSGSKAASLQGWEIFRNIANTLFIILLLVVIFSQLTGVGIDNYGIKKVLPKLIISAILINLSYWICIALVDVSNIVGNSLQSLLNGLANGIDIPDNVGGVSIGGELTGALVVVAVLGALVADIWATAAMSGGAVGILLMLLMAAISVAISILFLFLLLAAREAAIVVLVVIVPLAVAAYMLPNTESMAKKWWKIFSALLLVYPIAGLLVGGGNFVSKMLLAAGAGSEGFFSAFAAMIAGVVPIFFIPNVVKKSFAALGDLGSKISGIGKNAASRVSGNVGKTVQGSQKYQNYQADRGRQRKIKAANRTMSRYQGRDKLNDRQRRAYGQALSIKLGEQEEEARRENLLNSGYDAAEAGIKSKMEDEAVRNEEAIIMNDVALRDNTNELQERLSQAISAGDANKIRAYQNVLSRKGDTGREAVRRAMVDAKGRGDVADGMERVYASNLMNNWANDYKNDNRSTFDYAKNVLKSNSGTAELTSDTSANIGDLKTPQAASMDDDEFERLLKANGIQLDGNGQIIGGTPTNELRNYLNSALQDQNAMMGAKESRRNMIRQVVGSGSGGNGNTT